MVRPLYLKHTPGCPQANWAWLGCTDLKEEEGRDFDDYETCQFCGHERIRFVHRLEHIDWPGEIRVGRICASHYTRISPAELERAEAILKNRSQRRQRFPTLRAWRTSAKGNSHIDYLGNHIIVLKQSGGGFGLKIGSKFGRRTYATERDAMLKAFDFVSQGRRRVGQ